MDDVQFVAFIKDVTRGKGVDISKAIEDSGLDSLDLVEIVFALEEMGCNIPLDKLDTSGLKIAGNKTTVKELFQCVEWP
jgi:acyl carrier protein